MEELLPNPSESQSNNNNSNSNNNNNNENSQNNSNNNYNLYKDVISTENIRYDKAPVRSLPTTVYYGLEYPADVQNPDKAIESVGGLSKITKVIKSREKEYLQLKFRPNNPTCKPSFGTKSPTCNVLLRVRPVKEKPIQYNENEFDSPKPILSPNSPSIITNSPLSPSLSSQQQNINNNNNEKPKFEASVIALVPTTIKFDGLSDFQYLIKENKGPSKKSQYYAENNETEISRDEPMNLIPPLFSRVDFPMNYQFKSNPHAHFDPETKQFLISKQPIRKSVAHCHFDGETPTKPINLPNQLQINDLMKKTLEIMKSLFEKRPIWLYVVLVDNIVKAGGLLTHVKKLLPTIAFNYVDGPWRKCWVKLGFDPRTEQNTYKYQVIDFRITDQENHFANFNNNSNSSNNKLNIYRDSQASITPLPTPKFYNQIPTLTNSSQKDRDINVNTDSNMVVDNEDKDNSLDKDLNKDSSTQDIMDTSEDNNDSNNNNISSSSSNDNSNNNSNNNISSTPNSTTIPLFSYDQSQKVNPSRKKNLVINTFEFQTSKSVIPQIPASYEGYDYTFKTPPSHYNSLYQICDIEEPTIKAFFQQQQIQSSCLKKTGWFTEASFKEGVEKMKNRYGLTDYRMRSKSIKHRDSSTPKANKTIKNKIINYSGNNVYTLNNDNIQLSDQDSMLSKEEIETTRETLEQIEKDNKFINMKKEFDPYSKSNSKVGGFDNDENDTAFRILDDDEEENLNDKLPSVYSLASVANKLKDLNENNEEEDEDDDEEDDYDYEDEEDEDEAEDEEEEEESD